MKDRKTKEKKHESTIGKIIYGFLLFLPLFAIGVTCGYTMFNKNAYQSFSGTATYKETINITQSNDLLSGQNYYTLTNMTWTPPGHYYFNITNLLITKESTEQFNSNNYQYLYYCLHPYGNDGIYIYGQNIQKTNDNQPELTQLKFISNKNFRIEMLIFNSPTTENNTNYTNGLITDLKFDSYYVNTKLNDTFYYAVDKITKSPLFNWAENSIIYTAMSNFTTSLSITTSFIPLLLTYWLIISIVYFLYDIVLIILVVLHKKIHYLEESI